MSSSKVETLGWSMQFVVKQTALENHSVVRLVGPTRVEFAGVLQLALSFQSLNVVGGLTPAKIPGAPAGGWMEPSMSAGSIGSNVLLISKRTKLAGCPASILARSNASAAG